MHTKINIPTLLVLSILPDIDILYDVIMGVEIHRGPTHSIITALLVFTPIFLYFGKKTIPYFLALISHSILGDFLIGGRLQLLWPLSSSQFGLHELGSYYIDIFSPVNLVLEISLWAIASLILYRTGDWKVFFRADKNNLVLILPIATVLLPSTIGYPFIDPLLITEPIMAIAHLFYLVLFSIAILKTLSCLVNNRLKPNKELKV